MWPTSGRLNTWCWGLCAVFAAIAVVCIAWEPIRLDGWYIWFQYRGRPLSLAGWVDVIKFNYLHGNPRYGENITNLLYAPGWWHVVVHALLMTLSFWVLAALALGRRPRRTDALFLTTLLAMYLVAIPRVGPMLFYRPFFGNYVVGAVPAFAFLAMCHAYLRGTIAWRSAWLVVPVLLLGALGGMGNEHTGPAFVVAGSVAVYLTWRQSRAPSVAGRPRVPLWMLAGVVGLGLGFLGLFFAPGQMERYAGAGKVGVMTTLMSRSVGASLTIIGRAPFTALWLLPWFAIAAGAVAHWRSALQSLPAKTFGLALMFTTVVGGTLLAAPLNGPRLYYATAAVLVCAAAPWVVASVSGRRRLALVVVNSIVIVGSSIGLVYTAARERPVFERRMEILLAAQPNSSTPVVVPAVPKGVRQWTMGEDFRDGNLRTAIKEYFRIGDVTVAKP